MMAVLANPFSFSKKRIYSTLYVLTVKQQRFQTVEKKRNKKKVVEHRRYPGRRSRRVPRGAAPLPVHWPDVSGNDGQNGSLCFSGGGQ